MDSAPSESPSHLRPGAPAALEASHTLLTCAGRRAGSLGETSLTLRPRRPAPGVFPETRNTGPHGAVCESTHRSPADYGPGQSATHMGSQRWCSRWEASLGPASREGGGGGELAAVDSLRFCGEQLCAAGFSEVLEPRLSAQQGRALGDGGGAETLSGDKQLLFPPCRHRRSAASGPPRVRSGRGLHARCRGRHVGLSALHLHEPAGHRPLRDV